MSRQLITFQIGEQVLGVEGAEEGVARGLAPVQEPIGHGLDHAASSDLHLVERLDGREPGAAAHLGSAHFDSSANERL